MDENLRTLKQCQRNWSEGSLPRHDITTLYNYVKNIPQQQGTLRYQIIHIQNQQAKHDLNHIIVAGDNPKRSINPQVLANEVFLFTINTIEKDSFYVGLAAGLLAQKAVSIGYKTAFCKCGIYHEHEWKEWLDKYGLDHKKHPQYMAVLGIGTGLPGKPYGWDNTTDSQGMIHKSYPVTQPEIDIIK